MEFVSFSRHYTPGDAFVGYRDDMVASVVLQVGGEFGEERNESSQRERHALEEEVQNII